jgi:hypothetical protein
VTTIVCGERPGTTASTFRIRVEPLPGIVAVKSSNLGLRPSAVSWSANHWAEPRSPFDPGGRAT